MLMVRKSRPPVLAAWAFFEFAELPHVARPPVASTPARATANSFLLCIGIFSSNVTESGERGARGGRAESRCRPSGRFRDAVLWRSVGGWVCSGGAVRTRDRRTSGDEAGRDDGRAVGQG